MPERAEEGSTPAVAGLDSTWRKLIWDGLEQWASPRSVRRGRRQQRLCRLDELATPRDGKLWGWVHGAQQHASEVALLPELAEADPQVADAWHCRLLDYPFAGSTRREKR